MVSKLGLNKPALTHKPYFGYLMGATAIIFYAIINVVSQAKPTSINIDTKIYALSFVIIKEFFAVLIFLVLAVFAIKKVDSPFKEIKRSLREDPVGVIGASIGGIFGGALGFTFTTAGGVYIGTALGSPIYSLEIVFVFIAFKLIFKRSSNWWQVLGMATVFLSSIMIPVATIIVEGTDNSKNAVLGLILLIVGVACWAVESTIFDKMSERKQHKVATLVFFKQVSSFLFALILLLPLFAIFQSVIDDNSKAYADFGSIFGANSRVILYGFIAGVLLYFGRLFFFKSVEYIGATTANAIYSALPFIQTPIAYIANLFNSGTDFVGSVHHETFWVLLVILLAGIAITYYGQVIKNHGKRL